MSDTSDPAAAHGSRSADMEPRRDGTASPPRRPATRAEAITQTAARARIGIRELRQHASVYVDLAEKGYTVDITNRGRLVAQLIPVREPGSPLERLIAAGILEPAEEGGGLAGIDPYPGQGPGQPSASDVLGQQRRAPHG